MPARAPPADLAGGGEGGRLLDRALRLLDPFAMNGEARGDRENGDRDVGEEKQDREQKAEAMGTGHHAGARRLAAARARHPILLR